LTILVGLC